MPDHASAERGRSGKSAPKGSNLALSVISPAMGGQGVLRHQLAFGSTPTYLTPYGFTTSDKPTEIVTGVLLWAPP